MLIRLLVINDKLIFELTSEFAIAIKHGLCQIELDCQHNGVVADLLTIMQPDMSRLFDALIARLRVVIIAAFWHSTPPEQFVDD